MTARPRGTSSNTSTSSLSRHRFPAEWEPHAATWLAWPHYFEDWPGKFEPIPWVYAEIIRHLTAGERVRLIVQNAREERSARDCLQRAGVDLGKVDFFPIPTDRVWMRDSGPIFVRDGNQKIMLDWRFNAWAKYDNHKRDDKVPAKIGEKLHFKRIRPTYKNKR